MDRKLVRPSMLLIAAIVAAIVAGAAVPVSAEVFVVTFKNGNTIESSRQPEQASWDANTILVLTEVGNWVGVARNQIKVVEERSQIHGFGHRIDNTTVALADSINDLPEAPPATDSTSLYNSILARMAAQNSGSAGVSVQQGVQTESAGGGIPLGSIGLGSFPAAPPPPPTAPAPNPGGGAASPGGATGSGAPVQ